MYHHIRTNSLSLHWQHIMCFWCLNVSRTHVLREAITALFRNSSQPGSGYISIWLTQCELKHHKAIKLFLWLHQIFTWTIVVLLSTEPIGTISIWTQMYAFNERHPKCCLQMAAIMFVFNEGHPKCCLQRAGLNIMILVIIAQCNIYYRRRT